MKEKVAPNKEILDKKERVRRIVNLVFSPLLGLGLVGVIAISYFTPVVATAEFTLSPYQLAVSKTITDIDFGSYNILILSYYLYKYFYLAFAGIAAILFFLIVFFTITRNKKFSQIITGLMFFLLLFQFISTMIGFNYINVYKTIYPDADVVTFMHVFMILGGIIVGLKLLTGAILERPYREDMRESNYSIIMAFVQAALTLGALFEPLYIFPGTPYRMTGMDILLGKEDILSFLPMSQIYKTILMVLTIAVGASFLLSLLLYIIRRKLFVQYNKINIFLGFAALILYALMGLNYMLVYIDAQGYSEFFNTSMNTFSYISIALFALFWLGAGFVKLTMGNMRVEYKVYATPDDLLSEGGSSKDKGSVPDPVPAFSELDKRVEQYNSEYEKRMEHHFDDLTLPQLVTHVIEYAKYSRERLSYGPKEVKTFIAGIAASRLSILQGMSGTGKTSLPKIFMESIDGFCEIVAVESSWRDKNELLGYYNEFTKKYTPKTFTQYLYKACLNREVPIFIVLDEMNLSRIEYYFSDFLSLMEARENLRFIKLFDVQLFPKIDERKNYLALRDGHTIDIPTNVWFIGTANRDESTFEISDKVYDRAQTMNFDKRASKVVITEELDYPQKYVPYSELRTLFEEAKKVTAFDAESYEPIKKIEKLLAPYKISFGNRVLKQIEEFVKVYVACSEIASDADNAKYVHEAVDCIIFSKVVRKLELKQVTDVDTLIEEFAALKMEKCEEFLHTLVETY